MKALLATIALTFALVGFAALAPTLPTQADSPPEVAYDSHLSVNLSVDCRQGIGRLSVRNTDMAGGFVEVTIDGVRQPDVEVDSTGQADGLWTNLGPGPHTISIIYDLVPGGTPDENDQPMSVTCAPAGGPSTTAGPTPTTTAPEPTTSTTGAPTTTTAPPTTTTPTTAPQGCHLNHEDHHGPSGVLGG